MERYEERCGCGSTGEATVETVQPRLQKRKRRVARRPSKSESLLNVV
jgi:hypothetical protein